MTNPDGSNPEKATQPPPSAPADLETQPPPSAPVDSETDGGVISNIVQRWKKEDRLKRFSLASRGFGLVFSILAFIIMVTNKHGDWKDFDQYEEYRFVVAISILSTLYTALQVWKQINELNTGKQIPLRRSLALVDFFGDQVLAYLLVSSASSAVPLTNRMKVEVGDDIFSESLSSSISMEFLAFSSLAISALVSGYRLTTSSFI